MNELYCLFVIFLIPFLLWVGAGAVYLLKADWVWNLKQLGGRNAYSERTPEWEAKIRLKGWFLVVCGFLYLLYVLVQFFDAGLFFPA